MYINLKEVIDLFLIKEVPIELVENYYKSGFEDYSLQDFCSKFSKKEWITGLSIIESSELIYKSAKENGNI